jgi:LAS superfamily LD-carboxypeptidase LdcB
MVTVVDGVFIEVETAKAFVEMQTAARREGIELVPLSGFRSMIRQQQLWKERQDPAVRAVKGGAARPGYSNHQTGIAIDIRTGLTFREFGSGKRSAVYDWLEANAATFGFKRTVKSEPWHWEFKPEELEKKYGYGLFI